MARTSITPITAAGSYATAPVQITFTAADIANFNQAVMSGKDLLLINNTDVGAQTVTVNSVSDPYSRTGDITAFSMATGTFYMVGPLFKLGWAQSGGVLFFQGSTATVKFALIQIPN